MVSFGIGKSFWSGKKVLITGHTGFKGSWLCLWLTELGASVSGISLLEPVSNPNMFDALGIKKLINDYRGDVIDLDICKHVIDKSGPDIMIHMAAQPLVRKSYLNPLGTFETNILGTANILEATRYCSTIKVILVVTSDKCYENIETDYLYTETDSLGGYDPYSSSKACAEHIASAYYRSYFREKGMGLATARAGNVIGGGDWSDDRLIPDAAKRFSQNKKLVIRYPQATRPWQHVLEPLSGYMTLCEKMWDQPLEFSEGWNFGPEDESICTVKQIADRVSELWGDHAAWEKSNGDHPHEETLLKLGIEKAKVQLCWNPRWDLDTALGETVTWYKSYYNSEDVRDITLRQIKEFQAS